MFKTTQLKEVLSISNGKRIPANPGPYPVYGGNGICGHVNVFNQKDCIVVGRVGAYCGSIYYAKKECWVTDNALVIKCTPETDLIFIYNLLKMIHLNEYRLGSSQPLITKSVIQSIEVTIPEKLEDQKKIAKILQTLDNQIETLTEINDNLLKSAKAAFSEMMSTSELSNGVLSDVASIIMGQSPPGESLSEDSKGTLFYQGRAEFGTVFPTPRLYTTDPRRMAKQGSILMSVRAPVGDINVALEECCIGRGLAAIESNNGMQGFVHYLMDYLKPELDIFNGDGTVFGSINNESINSVDIALPEQNSIEQFNTYAEKVDAEIKSNHLEILKLSEIRDYLLPKLMSGEIDVSTLEIPN